MTQDAAAAITSAVSAGYRFEGQVRLTRTGAFGYTVRVLPRHGGLASPAELGLVTNAS